MSNKGKLFLIPTYLDESNGPDIIAPMVKDVIANTKHYLVEQTRTARRFISSLQLGIDISTLSFETLNKHTSPTELHKYAKPLSSGQDVGVMSEAGLPGIADPGRLIVDFGHRNGIDVVPLPGPSSIILALIASGMDGQQFSFHGYLPIDKGARTKKLLSLQQEVSRSGATQIFMETPYRNNQVLQDMLSCLSNSTLLCIAACITGAGEFIQSETIGMWKKDAPDLHKKPTIFCLGRRP